VITAKNKMRHAIAALVVLGALFSAMFIYPADLDAASIDGHEVHFVNLIWSLYYGIGFEPAFIWYKIFGPFPTGFVDVFGMIFYPIIASALLYAAILRLSRRSSSRKWLFLVLGLSFLAIVPRPNMSVVNWWKLPLWINGAMSERP
jgi:predicted membrane protein